MVIPPFYSQNVAYWTTLGVGAGYLSEYLTSKNVENHVLDMRLNHSKKILFDEIKSFKPDLIGFQILTYRRDVAFSLIEKTKQKFNIKIVIGGPHVSLVRPLSLEESKADFAIKVEGEETLYELMSGVALKNIKGLIYKKDNVIVENPDRPFIKNLDALPFPKYKKFDLKKYDKVIPLFTSRGCPFGCTFCTVKLTMGRIFRYRSAKNIFEEIKYWYKQGYRTFHILDDNFTLMPERIFELCDLLIANFKDIELALPNGVRADKISKELLIKMKKTGFTLLGIGVESASKTILKNIQKHEKLEEIEKAIKLSTQLGFDVELFFTIGNQGETKGSVRKSFELAKKYPIADVKFNNVIPFPNTELFEWVSKNGTFRPDFEHMLVFQENFQGEPFFETPELTLEDRKQLLKEARELRDMIIRKNLTRKLSRFGYLGKMLVFILYLKPINATIRYLYSQRFTREPIKRVKSLLFSDIRHF
ncbi:hypothetical protein A3K72_01030 [Candidatus Woesearchaeota archaeon RBG_13_36_6]|nr:MAG: hypothetical protein A3K72_01030 [Candidatus Woesearchaeota archaeon RBG_13_36_6]